MAMSRVALITRAFVACVFSHQVSDVQRMGSNRRASAEEGVDGSCWICCCYFRMATAVAATVATSWPCYTQVSGIHRMNAGGDIGDCGTD